MKIHRLLPAPLLLLAAFNAIAADSAPSSIISHSVTSEYQNGTQEIRVLLPTSYDKNRTYRVVYVLPVEAGFASKYGYALGEFETLNVHNDLGIILVEMGFEKEPWYGDHATDPKIRQAAYLKEFVVPFVEQRYATFGTAEGRLLFGFSKSGWGAFSLIFKYPEFFGYAAAWDAPLLFQDFHISMKPVYGTKEQLALFRPDLLIPKQSSFFQARSRLVLAGEKDWGKNIPARGGGSHTVETHALLDANHVLHHYDNTLAVPHRWDKGWMLPTLKALLELTAAK